MQLNSKCRLCGDRDEMINHIISKCSKLAQKEYKTRYDWVSKVIHRKLCKKFKFEHTTKWYMHNSASVLENETHKLQWDLGTFFTIFLSSDSFLVTRRSRLKISNQLKFSLPQIVKLFELPGLRRVSPPAILARQGWVYHLVPEVPQK